MMKRLLPLLASSLLLLSCLGSAQQAANGQTQPNSAQADSAGVIEDIIKMFEDEKEFTECYMDELWGQDDSLEALLNELLDYRREHYASPDVDADLKWMAGFRRKLAADYKRYNKGEGMTDDELVNYVISYAIDANKRGYSVPSFMVSMATASRESEYMSVWHFGEIQHLMDACQTEGQKSLLRAEVRAFDELRSKLWGFVLGVNMVFADPLTEVHVPGKIFVMGALRDIETPLREYIMLHRLDVSTLEGQKTGTTVGSISRGKDRFLAEMQKAYDEILKIDPYEYADGEDDNRIDFFRKMVESLGEQKEAAETALADWLRARRAWEQAMGLPLHNTASFFEGLADFMEQDRQRRTVEAE